VDEYRVTLCVAMHKNIHTYVHSFIQLYQKYIAIREISVYPHLD